MSCRETSCVPIYPSLQNIDFISRYIEKTLAIMAYNGKFFIQDKLDKPFKHHESFKQLWETKWKKPVR